jgi:hypothetical protein
MESFALETESAWTGSLPSSVAAVVPPWDVEVDL